MKTSPAISARQPTAHAQRGWRAEFNVQKDLRSEKEQQPPECVSLWKTGKERELSTSVKETHAKQPESLWINRNRSRMGIRRNEYQF